MIGAAVQHKYVGFAGFLTQMCAFCLVLGEKSFFVCLILDRNLFFACFWIEMFFCCFWTEMPVFCLILNRNAVLVQNSWYVWECVCVCVCLLEVH